MNLPNRSWKLLFCFWKFSIQLSIPTQKIIYIFFFDLSKFIHFETHPISCLFIWPPPPQEIIIPPLRTTFLGRIGPEILATHTRRIDPTSSDHHLPSINSWTDSCPDASFLWHWKKRKEKIVITKLLKMNKASLLVTMVVVVMLLAEAKVSQAVTCNPGQLSPCLPAISSSSPPSTTCCSKLKEQKPCLCGYLKDPALKQFVSSPGARKVASACGVPYPSC